MRTRVFLFLCAAGLVLGAARMASASGDNVLADELTVKSAGLPVDGPGLLEFFRLRTKGEVAPDRLKALIEQLGSKDGAEREKACAELVSIGPSAIPALRTAAKDPDAAEAAGLARRGLEALQNNSASVSAAAVRLLAQRKPEGATAALLAYLPYTEDESLQEEVKAALAVMAYRDGKADPALLKALTDDSPMRRAVAVDVLCQNGLAEPRDALRKLLADPKPTVQLRAALALAQARDANAVETLIDLLGKLPVNQGRFAEEYLTNLVGDQSPKETLTDDASRAKVHDAWAAWWKSTEGTASLDEFSRRTLTEADREKAEKLIRQLGDDSFDARQKAKTELQGMGVLVIRMLRSAVNDPDLEISQSARFVLQEIEKDKAAPLSPTAARVVALRKPQGAAEVLLAYLPFCDDESILGEVQAALNAVAYPDGKPAEALVKALEDKSAVRRGAAAEALCLGPLGDNLPAVKKLLKDPEPAVRLQTALALAGGPHDRDAVPVLISLIGELTSEQSAPAEEYLLRLAADHGPLNLPQGDGDARAKRSALWAAWWKDNGERVALVDRYAPVGSQHYLGYTLLVQPGNNQIIELDASGKERLRLTGLANPQDVQALPGNRFLVTEGGAQRVTERDPKRDKPLWEKDLPNFFPMGAQRLSNGNTFIVCRNQLSECTRDGKDVFTIPRPNNDVLSAQKLRNNEIVVVSSMGMVQRLDTTGKELKSFRMVQNTWMVGNDILPNGNVLVVFPAPVNKVIEYDPDGKQVWESGAVMNPMAAARSPNGNTVIVSQTSPNKLVEVDKSNKQLNDWALPMNTTTNRVRRR
jgi:HEAT repeat protein